MVYEFAKTSDPICMRQLKRFSRIYITLKRRSKIFKCFFLIALFINLISLNKLSASSESVSDILPPVALCKNIVVSPGIGGTVTITGSDVDAGSYDPDGIITGMTVSPNTFTCSELGPNNVTLMVTDNEGLTSSCNATVIVEDRTPPVMMCRDHTLYLGVDGTGTLNPSDLDNGSADNCPTGFFMYLSRTTFDCSDIGIPVPVTLIGTDGSGNSSSCISQITVLDTISPVVNVKPFELVLGSDGTAVLSVSDIDNGSSDNCGGVGLSVSPDTFSCSDLGEKTVTLTAVDTHGNSASRTTTILVSTTLNISGIALTSCDLAPSLALFEADIEGGNGAYSYLWQGIEPGSLPFMIIIPFPPSLQFFNTSTLENPFFNNTMPDGIYNIRLSVTDGNGCSDTSQIRIRKTGVVFDNVTMKYSEACEGEIKTYSVLEKPDASYSWSVVNGTILSTDQDSSRIEVLWNMGISTGVVTATLQEPNVFFPGGQCESSVIDSVAISSYPVPTFNNPTLSVCSGAENTYILTGSYTYQFWTVTGGVITDGGRINDNFVTVRWGTEPSGTILVSAGNNYTCSGSSLINISIFNLSGTITSVTDVTCNGASDGTVTGEADAGSGQPPYSYSLDHGPLQGGGTFTGLSPGNHIITILDALSCILDLPFVISQPEPLSGIAEDIVNVSCFGGNNGSFSVSGSGGVSPYQYSLSGGPFEVQSSFTGLSAGAYTVTILDSHNCTFNLPVSITQPAMALGGTLNVTDVACYGELTGMIDLSVSGGTPPYSFLWSNNETTEDLTDIGAGDYSVTITDNNGCTVLLLATVNQPPAGLGTSAITINVACYGESTGQIDLSVAGGTPSYSYLWNNGSTTEDLININAGNYSVTITDSNGCSFFSTFQVTEPSSPLDGSITGQSDVLCKGGNDGSVSVTGSGGTSPYEYRIDSGTYQPTGTFGSLSAGSYTVTIRDANLCIFTLTVNIDEPSAALEGTISSQTDILCFGEATGSVTISASGGTSPYQYSIDGGSFQASGTFINLTAGLHTVIIRDKNLCTFSLPVNLSEPLTSLTGSVSGQTNADCYGEAMGSVTVTGSGGTPSYMYSIDGGAFQASGTFVNIDAGLHTVTIRDQNMCEYYIPVTITQPAEPLSVSITRTDVLCFGQSNGTATATASGGTPPYSYSWNTSPVQTTYTATGLSEGNYIVTVTDNNGCMVNEGVAISQPPGPLTLSVAITDVTCNGGSDGSIDLTVTNGTAPVSYLWSNGSITEDLTGVTAGTYSAVVTDVNGCTENAGGTISEPVELDGNITVTDATCYDSPTGSCDLTVIGGTPPYTYNWSNGAVTEDLTGVVSADYSVTVTDSNGCTLSLNATINQPSSPLSGSIVSLTDVTVYGGNDGIVTVSGSGGTPGYMYSLDSGVFQPSGTFSSLMAGSYSVTVRDTNLCTFDTPVIIHQPVVPLSLDIVSQSDILCHGLNSGSVTVSAWGGYTPYEYMIDGDPYQVSGTFGSLTAGSHTVTVRDDSLATFSLSFSLSEPEPLVLLLNSEDILCYGAATGTASVTASGGIAPYTYSWDTDPVQVTPSVSNLRSGNYNITVTDNNGCLETGMVTISEPPELIISSTVTPAACPDSNDGAIGLAITGGVTPYNIIWSDGVVTQNRTNLPPGTFSVVVTDQNLCAKSLVVGVSFGGTFSCVVIPQVITPNNDGYNDEWIIRNIEMYPDAEVLVYNRWGKLVFRTKNISANPWDGTENGKLVPTDSYHYILYLNDGSPPRSGVISVIR